jgi:long-chain acyl-CoA synthetase
MVRRALARPADTPAIEFEGQWHDWGWIAARAGEVQAALKESGVGDAAPVVFVPRNRPSAVAALLALLAKGRTVRMIYAFQSPEAIARQIVGLEPAAVILHVEDSAPEIVQALAVSGIAGIALTEQSYTPVPGAERAVAEVASRIVTSEPLIEILTSGTTGPPKQFPIRQSMVAEHFIGAQSMEPGAQRAAAMEPPGLLYFPIGNISGIYSTVPALVRGQRVCLLDRFSVAAWHDYVLRHVPARTGIPPACMRELLDSNIPPEDLSSIQSMGIGAAPLDPALQQAFEDRYGIPVLQSYGATEFGGPVCMWTADLHAKWGRAKLGSVGRPFPGASLRIVDPDSGAACADGEQGLLEVISPRIGPDWIRTSDMGLIDADGFLYLRGRADGAIMRGGFKILPETIETALRLHPAVADVAVIGIADSRLGEVPAAAVQLQTSAAGVTPELLADFLRRELLATQIPVHWHLCNTLPLNASMKVDRPAIRRIFEDFCLR